MIIKSRRYTIWVEILAIFMIQVSFLPRNCSSQFHWGKNYRLERKQLRDMFSQATIQTDVAPTRMVVNGVSPFKINGKKVYCNINVNIYLNLTLGLFKLFFNT